MKLKMPNTTNSLLILGVIGFSLVEALLFHSAYAGTIIRTETFDSDRGWIGLRNTDGSIGNNFGFSNTDNTGGLSPAGEAGGTIARTVEVSYYADTDLGGSLTLDQRIEASGEFDMSGVGAFNNGVFIGHRNTSPSSTDSTFANFIGFQIAEPQGSSQFRFRSKSYLNDGSFRDGNEISGLTLNGDYTWSAIYDPTVLDGVFTVELFNSGGSLGTSVLFFSAGDRAVGATFDAFGIGSGGLTPPENSPTNTVDVFIDNVSYSTAVVVSEPLSWIYVGICFAVLLGGRSIIAKPISIKI